MNDLSLVSTKALLAELAKRHHARICLIRKNKAGHIIQAWKGLAAYLDISVKTAQRWNKHKRFILQSHKHGHVGAYIEELEAVKKERGYYEQTK